MKNGRKPENKPIMGTIKTETFSGIIVLVKNKIEIIITNIILGMKDDTVSPYNDEISNCFRFAFILSNVILSVRMAVIKPTVNVQNRMSIVVFKRREVISVVIDCSQ